MNEQKDWEVKQLKELIDDFIVPMRDKPPYWAGTTPWCRIEDIDGKFLDGSKSNQVVDEKTIKLMNLKVFPVGTVICSCSARLGVCAIISRPLVSNQTCIGLVPGKNIETEYLYYQMTSQADVLQTMSSGTTIAYLPREKFEQFEIKIPKSKTEQAKIAEVLSTVDKAISETEALIAKQQRIKTGLMQDLLTRGIDENGNLRSEETHQFKDSPLGRIPVEWDIKNLSYTLVEINAGKSPECPDIPALGDEWGVLKVSAVHPLGFKQHENKVIINPIYINSSYEIKDGDLLITRANTSELVGLTCLVKNPPPRLLISDKTLRLVVNKNIAISEFIFYIMQMFCVRLQIEINATGSSAGMKNISQQEIKNLQIPLPKIEEQNRITNFLNSSINQINITNSNLIKLKNLKAGLMQDLLTGKKRVIPLVENDPIP